MRRPLHEFELDIAARFAAMGTMGASPKAEWVRGYLMKFGRGSPYRMWREWREFAELIGARPGTYASFATYMWILKRLGLVRVVRRERGARGFARAYYAIAPGMEGSPLWRRPMQVLYRKTDWMQMPEEKKARYR